MKTIFVIQDVKTKEYYYKYRVLESFSANISDAAVYDTEEGALDEIKAQRDWNTELFKNKFFEIKKYVMNIGD